MLRSLLIDLTERRRRRRRRLARVRLICLCTLIDIVSSFPCLSMDVRPSLVGLCRRDETRRDERRKRIDCANNLCVDDSAFSCLIPVQFNRRHGMEWNDVHFKCKLHGVVLLGEESNHVKQVD